MWLQESITYIRYVYIIKYTNLLYYLYIGNTAYTGTYIPIPIFMVYSTYYIATNLKSKNSLKCIPRSKYIIYC